jgi:hypothetical protein
MGVEKYDDLTRLVAEAKTQFAEFQGGKKVAAMRARKLLQQIKKLAQECRIEIQEIKKPKGDAPSPPPPA